MVLGVSKRGAVGGWVRRGAAAARIRGFELLRHGGVESRRGWIRLWLGVEVEVLEVEEGVVVQTELGGGAMRGGTLSGRCARPRELSRSELSRVTSGPESWQIDFARSDLEVVGKVLRVISGWSVW